MSETYTVRNMECEAAAGWMARAIGSGLRVLSRPVRFGGEECIVKRDGVMVKLTQARHAGKILDVAEFSPAQMEIVRNLVAAGLLSRSQSQPRQPNETEKRRTSEI